MTKILIFSGSVRKGSYNTVLAKIAAKKLNDAGETITEISLNDYAMPIYNGDDEAAKGAPENAKKLAALFANQNGIFIASPEYNASISPLLKNTLDWVSRVKLETGSAFGNKVFALGSASPGSMGGYRGLSQLRLMLELGCNAFVSPQMVSVSGAADAFNTDGNLKDARVESMLDSCLSALRITAKALSSA